MGSASLKVVLFWSFLAKAKGDQAFQSHVYGKIWPHSIQFWLCISAKNGIQRGPEQDPKIICGYNQNWMLWSHIFL